MIGLTDILRMMTVATVAMFVIFSSLDQAAEASHVIEHGQQTNSAATPGSDHQISGSSCHGVLLCLAAINQTPDYLALSASMQRIRNPKHANKLSHIAHPVFEPPPPRLSV